MNFVCVYTFEFVFVYSKRQLYVESKEEVGREGVQREWINFEVSREI